MALIDPLDLEIARLRRNELAENLPSLLFGVAQARAALETARRTGDDVPRAEGDLAAAQTALQGGRTALQTAKATLATLLGEWVPPTLPPADEISRLSSRYPIVFLPVRLETRFAPAQGTLKIRVYPDDLFGSTHEAELTEAEVAAGTAFLNSYKTLEDWKTLIRGRTPQRAGWILEAFRRMQRVGRTQRVGKADSWTLPVETHLLPDRWIAVGYRPDGTTVTAVSRPIEEPLRLTADPSSDQEERVGDLPVEPELKWTVDFDAAVAAGMGLEIRADSRGFDRLLVFGVKGSEHPQGGARLLRELFEHHRFSRGLALVRQGTPTNNTAGRDAGFPPDDQGGAVSYAVEFHGGLDIRGGDWEIFDTTLALSPFSFAHVEGANRREQASAKAMNNALWPVSFGYFLQHMLDPVFLGQPRIFTDPAIDEARSHFRQYVRGRGPCPAFRIGGVPYGVLPVSSLDRWKPDPGLTGGLDVRLPPKLNMLRRLWLAKAQSGAVRIGKNPNDPDDDLLRIIGFHPSARQVRVRAFLGDAFQLSLFQLLRRDWVPWATALAALARRTFGLIGEGGHWNVRIGRATASESAFLFRLPLVAPEPLREDVDAEGKELVERTGDGPVPDNYITWLRTSTIDAVRKHRDPRPEALLYYVLRHALLTEYARLAYKELAITDLIRHILEFIKIRSGSEEQKTIWDRFAESAPPPRRFPTETVEERIRQVEGVDYQHSFCQLAELSQAELERLFTETLDVASHRLDAWITSLVTKRLLADRRAEPSPASYLGAFAWVEDLRPASPEAASGGFIHAPSPAHAATAAVLRSSFLTRKPEAAGRFAFDLSSDRVRVARGVLEAVRTGQPAGAVLGYRFERALHEAALDRFIDPLRRRFPLIANKAGPSSDPPEAVAARNVVDGLALRLAWQTRASDDAFFAAIAIALPPSADEKVRLGGPLNALDAAVDGVADLLTAESVYQMVRGNAAGAAAPLDALAGGAQPPDPDVARTPRGGIPATHRLLWLWEGTDPDPWPWSGSSTRRSEAEPVLDDWAGRILGPPEQALCWVTFTDANVEQRMPISFAALRIRPLDVLELAQESPDTTQELKRRILQAAKEAGLHGEIDFAPAAGDTFDPLKKKTFPELLDLARQVSGLLARSRPGRPVDLLPLDGRDLPALSHDEANEFGLAKDFYNNVLRSENPERETDLKQLQEAIATARDLGPALRRAAEYVPGAFPDPSESDADLLPRAKLVKAELDRRADAAQAVIDAIQGSPPEGTPEDALAIYRAMFGRSFLRLPRFTLAAKAKRELDQAVAGLTLSRRQPGKFLQQNARVRAPLASWRRLWLYAEAGGVSPPAVDVAQLPFVSGEPWAGDDGVPEGSILILYVGYLDTEHGTPNPEEIPTPFDADAQTVLISTGGVATPHDTGVLRLENRTVAPVTVEPGLQVTTEQGNFQLWDDRLPITLAPGQNLVLAETANFNFATSGTGLGSAPVVRGRVNGRAFALTDTARVLQGKRDHNKTTPYQVLGRIEVSVIAASRLSLLLARMSPSRPDLTATSAALVVDDWTEVIPNAEEQTGIAFHYDNPGAEAAQAILVAVRPDPSESSWSLDDLTATLNETLDLAKVRAVEPELIGETRQALPALYLTANIAGEAVSTDFSGLLQDEPVRVPRRV
jgi:hypothetical protein